MAAPKVSKGRPESPLVASAEATPLRNMQKQVKGHYPLGKVITMNEYLMIGEVLKPQGVRGEVKVKPYAADLEAFHDWKTLYLHDGASYQPIKAVCSRVHDGFAYVTLGECKTMDDAEKLRGQKLYIDRAHALSLAEDEVYISDLIGCAAVDETGASLGKLTDVLQHGAVDVYVFQSDKGEWMAPALKAVFPAVDVQNRVIRVVREKLDEVAVYNE